MSACGSSSPASSASVSVLHRGTQTPTPGLLPALARAAPRNPEIHESTVNVKGLCNNPDYPVTSGYSGCPEVCKTSTDCNTSKNEICCDGLCTTNHNLCPKRRKQSSDCNAQICCKSALVRSPDLAVHIFSSGPTCTGSPSYTCSSSVCASIPGCTTESNGMCYSHSYSCATFNSYESECRSIEGCTYNAATSGSCSESLSGYTCPDLSGYSNYCEPAGCSYDSTTGQCSGTITPCSNLTTSTECAADLLCFWSSGSGSCTGTPTSCTLYTTSSECQANYNCYWSSSSTM
jgi:hypothetical protein